MKRTDLYKQQGAKIAGQIKAHGAAIKSGGIVAPPDRREQRRLDQAAGLIPFACKLNLDLVKQVQALAQTRGANLNDTIADLLKKGMEKG